MRYVRVRMRCVSESDLCDVTVSCVRVRMRCVRVGVICVM